MPSHTPECLPLTEAARLLNKPYEVLRLLVKDKVFTTVPFSNAKKRPRIFLLRSEVEAYNRGGINAVAATRKPKTPKRRA